MNFSNSISRYFRSLSGRSILILLLSAIALHFIFMTLYFQDTRSARRAVRRDAVIQKILNTIHVVEATPTTNREHAVAAIDDPVIHASVTHVPKWKKQFVQLSLWDIAKSLRNNLYSFKLSIMLSPNQWLNLNATIYSRLVNRQLILIGMELLILMAIVLAVWSVVRFTEPLKQFKESVDRLSVDLHTTPIDVSGPSAVQEAARAINLMQQRIQQLVRDRTQMLAAISHDLRTPITRLKIRAQFIEEDVQETIINDLDEMEKMIAETLSFAREDAAQEVGVKLDLVSLLNAMCDEMKDMGHAVSFETKLHRAPFVGRPIALKRKFTNLINNGIRYGGEVFVSIFNRHKLIFIKIEDRGPGIPIDEIDKVFEPFYRAESSRSRDTGGTGLGLAVTRDIITAHNGDIRLKNRREGGLSVVVRFDRASY